MFFCFLIILSSASLQYYSSETLPSAMRYLDGGHDSVFYSDTSNIIHTMFVQNSTSFSLGAEIVGKETIKKICFATANIKKTEFYGVMMESSMMLVEEKNKELTTYTKQGFEGLRFFSMGAVPANLFLLLHNTTTSEYSAQKYQIIKDNSLFSLTPPPDTVPVNIYSIGHLGIFCTSDGRMMIKEKNIDDYTVFQYSHSENITFMDVNRDEELIFTGDAGGTIILGNGSITSGFEKRNEYHEHRCPIVSIISVGSYLVSSDECGIMVQFDFENNVTLDRRLHPDSLPQNIVYLTQYLDSNFGVSAKVGDQFIYLYTVDAVKNQHQYSYTSDNITNQTFQQKQTEKATNTVPVLREVCKRIVMAPCLRLFLKLSMPWFVWLEDLYYYSYHHYDYNDGVTIFLMEMYFINEQKINPVLAYALEKNYLSSHLKFDMQNYQGRYPIRNLPKNETFDMYFLEYAKSIYIESLLQQLCFFLFVKIVFIGLRKCIKDPEKYLSIAEFEGNTIMWFFFLSFMIDNALYLSFACSAQIRTAFSFNFMDKINLVSSVICFFILISFSIGLFMLTLSFFPKKRVSQAALYQVESRSRGFVTECFIFGVRSVISGMIHGFLLDYPELQITLLLSVSGFITFWVSLWKKEFTYKTAYWFTFSYHLGFTFFNIFVLLEMKGVTIPYLQMNILHFFTLCCLLIIVALRFVSEAVVFMKERISFRRKVVKFLDKMGVAKNNKVAPLGEVKIHPPKMESKQNKQFYIFKQKQIKVITKSCKQKLQEKKEKKNVKNHELITVKIDQI